MCGIAGWNLKEKAPMQFYSTIASVIERRGEHSFGILDADTKRIMRGMDEITANATAEEIASIFGFIHTRYATTGGRTVDNTHPFEIGEIIGAHNGMIHNHYSLNITHKRDCKVDSQHIFWHILENKSLEELEGYGAIEYLRDGKLYIGRCSGELACARTSLGIVYASTSYAIQCACKQAGIEIETFYEVKDGEVYCVEKDALYITDKTFKLGERDWNKRGNKKHSRKGFRFDGEGTNEGVYDSRAQWEKELEAHDNVAGSGTCGEFPSAKDIAASKYDKCDGCNQFHIGERISGGFMCFGCITKLGLRTQKLLAKNNASESASKIIAANATAIASANKQDDKEDEDHFFGECDICKQRDHLSAIEIDENDDRYWIYACEDCEEKLDAEEMLDNASVIDISSRLEPEADGINTEQMFGHCQFCNENARLIERKDLESLICRECDARLGVN